MPLLTASDAGVEYLGAMRVACDRAMASAGSVESRLEIGGLRLRLRFAGPATARVLLPPFAHLEAEPAGNPEIEIDVFDTASTGIEAPAPPWSLPEGSPASKPVARWESDRACVLAPAPPAGITAADPVGGRAIFHLADAAAVPPHERAGPLREALHILTAPRGRLATHAGAVGRGGRGVLLVGRSGSGKSTLSLSCALAGMELAADDHVLLEMGTTPVAHAMHSTVTLTRDSAARLGLDGTVVPPAAFQATIEGPPKALLDIEEVAPGSLRPRLEVGAIVAPTLDGGAAGATRAVPISAARGLRALAPSSLIQMRSRSPGALPALARLARAVPSYSLALSPDPAANAAAVAEVVESVA